MKLGLENMRAVMERLGSPHGEFEAVAVAGSKGKGSFGAMLESVLLAAGAHAGLYTSPHLVSPRERIRLGGSSVTSRTFARLLAAVRGAVEPGGVSLTYFEAMTAMAIVHFCRKGARPAIFEVGLGGRLDATNIVPSRIAVVTEIEKEHTEHLGTRLGEIAGEKAGVLKDGGVLLSGTTSPTVRRVLEKTARQRRARARFLADGAAWHVTSHSARGLRMDLEVDGERFRSLAVGLAGRHQAPAAALVLMAVQELRRRGLKISKGDFRRGMAAAKWAGRCDYRPGRPAFFLDGAHTPSSTSALAAALEELFPARRKTLLYGVLGDKKFLPMATSLFPLFADVVLVRPPEERGADPAALHKSLPPALRKKCTVASDPAAGLALAEASAGKRGLVTVAGSLFLVGAVMAIKEF